uniref:HORMA domain-containing protein n=1 Tax=Caenorhabditis japonica TaxID=281687 RepID=A0A8R1DK48_CAEJA
MPAMTTTSRPTSKSRDSVTQQNASWSTTFPVELEIEKSSSTFAFRFIKCTTSFILDKRSLLSDTCFKTRTIEKLLVPCFKQDNVTAQRLSEKLDGLKAAISSRYLKEFAVVFYRQPDEEDVIEVYNFRLMYSEDGDVALSMDTGFGREEDSQNLINAKFTSLEDTKKQFVDALKKLHRCMKGLENIPEDADASFRISFTEGTPKDYMPKGFDGSSEFFHIDSRSVQLGIVCGGYHKVQMLAASLLLKPGRVTEDLNKTSYSGNQSLVEAPTPKKATSKISPKKKRIHPYGHTGSLERRNNV